MINTMKFAISCRPDLRRQIAPVVLGARDHRLSPLGLSPQKLRRCLDVNVLGVSRKSIGNSGELMSKHSYERRVVGKVRVQMSQRFPGKYLC